MSPKKPTKKKPDLLGALEASLAAETAAARQRARERSADTAYGDHGAMGPGVGNGKAMQR